MGLDTFAVKARLQALGITVAYFYLLNYIFKRVARFFIDKSKDEKKANWKEYVWVFLINFVFLNIMHTFIMFCITMAGTFKWGESALINVTGALLAFLYYIMIRNRILFKSLIEQSLQLEKVKVDQLETELKFLKSQYHPHFLFNALNTISCVCRENPERARELLVTLASYFRYNLDYEAYMVPMEEELDHVRDYLELEKARFEDKLLVTYDLPECMDIQIPTLILQPIVENAVRHGIDRKGKRIVHIRIEEAEDAFIVQVCDQGQGFKPEVLEKLENGEPIGKSIGLSNVHKRMKSTYGEDGGLKIESSPEGSCVELQFRKERVKENIYEDRGN